MSEHQALPFISVIMPIRNEADYIEQSLTAVLQQDYSSSQMEVIIVDGMSTDETRDIVAQVAVRYPSIPVVILDNPKHIVPTGMNIALAQAKGEIIVRVDGHCKIAPDYVSRCVAHLQKGDSVGVGGPIETMSETPSGETIALAMQSSFGVGGSAFRTVKDRAMFVDTIAFPAYTRKAIEHAGLYDEELMRNQDDEYNYRLRALGYKILLTPDVRSQYYSRTSLRKLWRQYFQYGYYKVRVLQKHPAQMQLRQFVPPIFVAVLVGGAILAPLIPILLWLWLMVIGLYATVNILASLRIASQTHWRHFTLLPLTFATLHLSYGLGFLKGLISFRSRWRQAT
ncbi:MAG: glycosyltransferase family 2 protein [Anaerolineales bacterium]|nr:glycosyltransferase family 2 protein [Anaerolineales bacterium]